MAIKIIRKGNLESLEERKDARKRIDKFQPILAECRTMDSTFEAPIQNVSTAGVFIKTSRRLSIGQEIAITFTFPQTRQTIMVNGEIVRITREGVGVKIKMFFKE
ncbi:MAG: PilZ domain-containing protein [Desulfobacteraceae bacterium]|jgi:Tfp pilus assembly protein PilZ